MNNDWVTPQINTLQGTDNFALQQIFRNIINEIQRLNAEIEAIKTNQNVNTNSSVLKLR